MAKITIGMNPDKVAAAEKRSLAEQQAALPWTPARKDALREALVRLAEACDGAREQDGSGFSRDDAWEGRDLAYYEPWLEGDLERANEIARKYRFTQVPRELAHRIWPIEFPYDDGDC